MHCALNHAYKNHCRWRLCVERLNIFDAGGRALCQVPGRLRSIAKVSLLLNRTSYTFSGGKFLVFSAQYSVSGSRLTVIRCNAEITFVVLSTAMCDRCEKSPSPKVDRQW